MSGCSPAGIKAELNTYSSRLENVLEKEAPEPPSINSIYYPSASALRQKIEEQSISLRIFYQLEKCPAKPLIAERNTALGRTQLPSQRFLYEHKISESLQLCIKHNPDAAPQLQKWLEAKQQNLPKVWSNMLQLSEEIKVTLTLARSPLKIEDQALLAKYNSAWQNLYNSITGSDSKELEETLAFLKLNPLPAKVWQAQAQISAVLSSLTPWLREHAKEQGCQEPQTAYLNNVLNLYFVEKVQPLANVINQFHYAMQNSFKQLLQDPVLRQEFKDVFVKHHLQGFQDYQQAMHEHVQFWQTYLKQCGISPGRSSA